jgi:hypothetical protein
MAVLRKRLDDVDVEWETAKAKIMSHYVHAATQIPDLSCPQCTRRQPTRDPLNP